MTDSPLDQALQSTLAILTKVGSADLDAPTPCASWDVRALVNHFVGTARWWAAIVAGAEAPAGETLVRLPYRQKIRRGVHKGVQALEADIRQWIEHWNEDPKPFARIKTAEEILNSLAEYITRISGGEH